MRPGTARGGGPIDRLERGLRRTVQLARGALRPLRRIPVEIRFGAAALAVFVGAFAAAVVPLLTTGGRDPQAEVAAKFPSQLKLGDTFVLPLAIDNVSGSVISPLCLIASVDPAGAIAASQAVFQGLETIRFVDGRACGGQLSGQESISVMLTLVGRHTGPAQITLVAGQGAREIGPPLRGRVEVTP